MMQNTYRSKRNRKAPIPATLPPEEKGYHYFKHRTSQGKTEFSCRVMPWFEARINSEIGERFTELFIDGKLRHVGQCGDIKLYVPHKNEDKSLLMSKGRNDFSIVELTPIVDRWSLCMHVDPYRKTWDEHWFEKSIIEQDELTRMIAFWRIPEQEQQPMQ